MKSPMHHRSYELLLRTASIEIDLTGDWRVESVMRHLFASATELGATMERANSSPTKERFRAHLHDVHSCVRQFKLWLKVLDDLGRIKPEIATPIYEAAEDVHKLVLTALKTSNGSYSQNRPEKSNGLNLVES